MTSNAPALPYWRLSSFYFFYYALLGAWLPFWPLYLQLQGFDAVAIGYLGGILLATKIVAPNVWGWLTARTGKRMPIVQTGSLLALVLFAAMFYRPSSFVWQAMVITGFSFFWNAVLAQFEVTTLAYLGGQQQRYSQIRVWGSVGFICLVTLLGWLFDFVSVSVLPWIIVVLLAEHPQAATAAHPRRSLAAVLKQPRVLLFLLGCFFLQVSHGPYYTFFSVMLEAEGYSRTVTGLMWSLGVVAEVVIFLFMHRLLARFTLRGILLTSLLLTVLRWLLIALFPGSWPVLILAQCLHAASFGSFHACAVEWVRRTFSDGLEGQGMALYSGLSFGAGGALGAVLAGRLWQWGAPLSFLLAAAAALAAALLILGIKAKDFAVD